MAVKKWYELRGVAHAVFDAWELSRQGTLEPALWDEYQSELEYWSEDVWDYLPEHIIELWAKRIIGIKYLFSDPFCIDITVYIKDKKAFEEYMEEEWYWLDKITVSDMQEELNNIAFEVEQAFYEWEEDEKERLWENYYYCEYDYCYEDEEE